MAEIPADRRSLRWTPEEIEEMSRITLEILEVRKVNLRRASPKLARLLDAVSLQVAAETIPESPEE